MRTRPTSITVICWILIVMGAIAVIFIPLGLMYDPVTRAMMDHRVRALVAGNLLPLSVQWGIGVMKILVVFTTGIAMLKRQNWGRLLYTIWGAADFIQLATAPAMILVFAGLIVYMVIVFFLFSPKADRYFGGSRSQMGV